MNWKTMKTNKDYYDYLKRLEEDMGIHVGENCKMTVGGEEIKGLNSFSFSNADEEFVRNTFADEHLFSFTGMFKVEPDIIKDERYTLITKESGYYLVNLLNGIRTKLYFC